MINEGEGMDPNLEREQRHVVVNTPGQQREVVTDRTVRVDEKDGPSAGTIGIIAVLAILAIGVIVYLVTSQNSNDAANRNANALAATQANTQQPQQAPVIVQQPAQQAPVVIQQPAPAAPAPVMIQQPADPSQRQNTSANDDANMQDAATKRLADNVDMTGVVVTVNDARAVLTGTVSSEAAKAKAEQLVKSVRGVKSVDNKLVAST
jgi:type IV secretory pathway VirB10-like protein